VTLGLFVWKQRGAANELLFVARKKNYPQMTQMTQMNAKRPGP